MKLLFGNRYIIWCATLACGSSLLFGLSARAQSPGFSVSPVKTFIELRRGEVSRGVFEVVNRSEAPLPLEVTAEFFGVSDEAGSVVFRDSLGIASAQNPGTWLALAHPFLLLNAHETRAIAYTLSVPQDASFGTYMLSAIFQSKFPAINERENNAQLLPGISALFFIDVVPRQMETPAKSGELKVKDFSIPDSQLVRFRPFGASLIHALRLDRISLTFIKGSPFAFTARLSNEGRYLARPSGTVSVFDMFGNEVGRVPFPDGAVLPGALRAYAISFSRNPRFPSLGFVPDFIQRGFPPGRYTARLTLDSNSSRVDSPRPFVISFWTFPWLFTLSTAVPLTLLLIFVVLYKKRILASLKTFLWPSS